VIVTAAVIVTALVIVTAVVIVTQVKTVALPRLNSSFYQSSLYSGALLSEALVQSDSPAVCTVASVMATSNAVVRQFDD
jgi:hypothetical protein